MTRTPAAVLVLASLIVGGSTVGTAQGTIERGHAVDDDMALKIWVPAGSVRLRAWDLDSLHVRGAVDGGSLLLGGARGSWKLMVEGDGEEMAPAELDIRLPRGAQVSVKTITATIVASDVTGWFNSVRGDVILNGTARRLEAETLDGDIAINGGSPWLSVRTGSGTIKVEGLFRDVRASSVSGGISILNKLVDRGRFESVSGDIRYRGHFATESAMEFDSHSGTITLVLPENVAGRFRFTTITGPIENTFSADRPTPRPEGVGEDLEFTAGEAATGVVVRSFKGTIRLRRME
jgi:hypothetical protein